MTRIETHTQNTLKREQKTRLGNVYESIHRDGEVLVTYTGPLDSNVVESILKLAERSILQKGSSRSEMKQVCKVLIECFRLHISTGAVLDARKSRVALCSIFEVVEIGG